MKQIGYSFQVLESEATTEVHVALELSPSSMISTSFERKEKKNQLFVYLFTLYSFYPFSSVVW